MSDTPTPPTPTPPEGGRPKRRVRYAGRYPRRFEEKYKEHNPEKYPETLEKVLASGKTPAGMHRSVMLQEILDVLSPQPGEIGIDCTLGFGGHATELWKRVQPDGKLFAFDVDPIELPKTEARLRAQLQPGDSLVITHANFAGLRKTLHRHNLEGVDFILADLGVSSMQLDDPSRGFSFKKDGPLDLRMNPRKGQSAADWLASASPARLAKALQEHADEPRAEWLAEYLVAATKARPIRSTYHLARVVEEALNKSEHKPGPEERKAVLQRLFQALRIAVNEEFSALEMLLREAVGCLNPGGRLAILTFHSGEDRRVKQAFEHGWRNGMYTTICQEVVRPSAEERHANPRASCAKLRWAIRSHRTQPLIPEPGSDPLDHPLVRFQTSGIHGTGGFAINAIEPGTHIIEYIGERIDKAEAHRRCSRNNQYIFSLDDESDIDGDVAWNPARFINHSCDPNCEALNEEGLIWIVSKRSIQPGEELTFNYGFDLENYKEYPCACGAANCVGFIIAEEFHETLREQRRLITPDPDPASTSQSGGSPGSSAPWQPSNG